MSSSETSQPVPQPASTARTILAHIPDAAQAEATSYDEKGPGRITDLDPLFYLNLAVRLVAQGQPPPPRTTVDFFLNQLPGDKYADLRQQVAATLAWRE